MKNLTTKSLTVLIMIGAFSLISFAQTTLNLDGNATDVTGNVSSKEPVEYIANLNESKLVCVSAKSTSTINVTFDGKPVTPNSEPKCYESTRTGSYSIKITTALREADYIFRLNFTDVLKWDESGIASVSDSISSNQVKTFNIKLASGKTVCFGAASNTLRSTELDVFLQNTKYVVNGTRNCSLKTTETKFYEIVVRNRVAKNGDFGIRISYQ